MNKVEYTGTVWALSHNDPEPLVKHSIKKLLECGIKEDDIKKYRGVEIDPDLVMIVPGGKVTMFFAIKMFGEPGTEIIYPNPGFPIYESVINYTGATPIPMPLHEDKGYGFDADEVLSLINRNTRLLIINLPSNPMAVLFRGRKWRN